MEIYQFVLLMIFLFAIFWMLGLIKDEIRMFERQLLRNEYTSINVNASLPGNSEYNIFSSNLFSYGFEVNYLYKTSQRFRFLINMLDNITFKHNGAKKENIPSYGFGIRIKSILGPIDFLWVKSDKKLIENNKMENYYFSIGIDY